MQRRFCVLYGWLCLLLWVFVFYSLGAFFSTAIYSNFTSYHLPFLGFLSFKVLSLCFVFDCGCADMIWYSLLFEGSIFGKIQEMDTFG